MEAMLTVMLILAVFGNVAQFASNYCYKLTIKRLEDRVASYDRYPRSK